MWRRCAAAGHRRESTTTPSTSKIAPLEYRHASSSQPPPGGPTVAAPRVIDERRGPHRSAEQSVPELLGSRNVVTERDRVHLDAVQSAVFQQSSELILVSEPEEGWASGNVFRRCRTRLGECVEEHADEAHPYRLIPCGKGDPPAGPEHPDKLTHSLLWPRQMEDHEVPNDSVE
jgi:hypothetical protein